MSIDLSKIPEEKSNTSSDSEAIKEKKRQYAAKDLERKEQLKNDFHRAFRFILRVVFILLLILFSVRYYHLIAPEKWIWLKEKQIQGLDKILYSSTAGGLIGRFANKMFEVNGSPSN